MTHARDRLPALTLALLLCGFSPLLGEEEEPATLGFLDCLNTWCDLESLPYPDRGMSSRQISSRAPSEERSNRDFGHYLRSSPEEGAVLAELEGPGCLTRIWSANPSGRLAVYLDGEKEPVLDEALQGLFEGDRFPFQPPLTFRLSGAWSLAPIPFQKSCKLVLRDNQPLAYHIGYKTYPPDTRIESFQPASMETLEEAATETLALLNTPGPEQVRALYPSDLEEIPLRISVDPGLDEELFTRNEPGRIAFLELKVSSLERHALRKTLLKIYWDQGGRAAVNCPLGDFFGSSFGETHYRALPMGMTETGGYCLFPMPFQESASILVENQGEKPITVTGRLLVGPLPRPGPALWFHAGWRRENPCLQEDYPVLRAYGNGLFVGCALFVDNPGNRGWIEGDEKIRVDGAETLAFHGTGTADYFGDAWGVRRHVTPFSGCSLAQAQDNKACLYRFHLADAIPFSISFEMNLENYRNDVDYASVVWWYGDAPDGGVFFQEQPVAQRIPKPPQAAAALEAEDLQITCSSLGSATIVNDESLPRELSQGQGVLLKGAGPFALKLEMAEGGRYRLALGPAQGLPSPALKVLAPPGMPLRPLSTDWDKPDFLEAFEVAEVELKQGVNLLYLHRVNTGESDQRLILDFIRLDKYSPEEDKK